MDDQERNVRAGKRAQAYAPAPTGGALMAGLCTAVVAVAVDYALSEFYGWEIIDNPMIAMIVGVAGFVIGFMVYAWHARNNRRAIQRERRLIDAQEDEGGAPDK